MQAGARTSRFLKHFLLPALVLTFLPARAPTVSAPDRIQTPQWWEVSIDLKTDGDYRLDEGGPTFEGRYSFAVRRAGWGGAPSGFHRRPDGRPPGPPGGGLPAPPAFLGTERPAGVADRLQCPCHQGIEPRRAPRVRNLCRPGGKNIHVGMEAPGVAAPGTADNLHLPVSQGGGIRVPHPSLFSAEGRNILVVRPVGNLAEGRSLKTRHRGGV